MKHTSAAAWRLRQGNPVPDDAFGGSARDSLGRAAFERIITSAATPPSELARVHRMRARSAPGGPARSGRRLALRFAIPVVAVAAAVTASAVALSSLSAPSQRGYTLDAFLTVYPSAHPSDAAAVLRQLAARAAAQPTQALGPVEFSSNREWEYVGSNIPRNLNYFSRHSWTHEAWDALSGASAVHIVRNFDGKVFTSSYPADKWSAPQGAWIDPASLPDTPSALRQHLLSPPDGMTFGYLTWQVVFVSNAIRFMSGEPLPPAVRSAMLRVLAQIADHPGRGYTYVDMGTATDHLGRTGVVIGQEQANSAGPQYVGVQSLIFDPRTGALLDVANAQCDIRMGAIPRATGQCTPDDYTEFNLPKAVSAVPQYQAHIPGLIYQAGGPYV